MSNPLAASVIDLYRRHGEHWAALRHAQPFPETGWLGRFASGLADGGDVLDLGCGSGRPIGAWLAARGFALTGVDTAGSLLAQARAALPGQAWIEADMRSLALGRRFSGVLAWDSFFHLDHDSQRGMFQVFAAHSAPGAPLMFTSGPRHGEAIGCLNGDPLFHASLSPEEYRGLLEAYGFEVVAFTPEDPACGSRTVWLARRRDGPALPDPDLEPVASPHRTPSPSGRQAAKDGQRP
ncbi:trans-aconitate 2-methyltransferase [Geothrix sp. 21YS21S-2]|uniref:class I SAM-dependent methyltransferase n=1 Tax=Geothrix sp. 21YS21S-2 TaxID=3068893 RepID=UPI0027B9917F|nr:class I SAM-dependent methyltransferase [Geothrix sp. 21YS21S-2]